MSPRKRSASRRWQVCALAAGGVFLAAEPLVAQESEAPNAHATLQQQTRAVFEKVQGAVVKIEASDEHGRLSGTGFFIDPNGTLYTCYTVGGETRDIVVNFDGVRYPADRVISDLRSGVAILKIEAQTPFLSFGKSRALQLAAPVMVIGYPMDLPATPSFGVVGGLDIKFLGRFFATTHIRANVPVQRGEGGAPLLDMNGGVVGILISSIEQGSASFALPIEAAEKVRRDYLRFRAVRRGWLGIEVAAAKGGMKGSTAEVQDVLPDSPGSKAGLHRGDRLLQIGERRIASPEDVLDAAFYLTASDAVAIRVAREDQELQFELQPIDHPSEPAIGRRLEPIHPIGPELHFQPLREEP